jgi:hypothetical protein
MNPIEKVLRHNINMMREHNKAPSFVQVLLNFQLAADEIKKLTDNTTRKCLVRGCLNHSDAGTFIGDLCEPCHRMLTTGDVHHTNITFIGELRRGRTS